MTFARNIALCIALFGTLATFNSDAVVAGEFIFYNNTRMDVAIAWVTEETIADATAGDLPTVFTTTYHVKGWKKIVPGGQKKIKTNTSVLYALIRTKDESGHVRHRRFFQKRNGQKMYQGFLVNMKQGFYATQNSSPEKRLKDVEKLAGRPPRWVRGEVVRVSKGATGKWGEFGLGDLDLSYMWGFGKFQTRNGKMEYYIEK